MKKIVAGLMAMILAGSVQAVLITTSGSGAGADASLTIAQDLTFDVTADSSGYLIFVIEDCVTSYDNHSTGIGTLGLTFTINDGETTYSIQSWSDNFAPPGIGVISGYDSAIINTDAVVFSGDQITIKAGTLSMADPSQPEFSVFESGDYNLFLADTSFQKIGSLAVPEPATALSLLIGGGMLTLIRRFYGRA